MQRLLNVLFASFLLETSIGHAQDLSVTMNGNDSWVTRFEPLEFTLSRPLLAGEHLAVLIGATDVSDLCVVHGDSLSYQPQTVPLPSGHVTISIFLMMADGAWTSVGNQSLSVLTSTGLEKLRVAPTFTFSNKGQLAEDHFPEQSGAPRKRFQELNGSMGLKAEFERSGVALALDMNIIGMSFKQEALRFAEKREDASKIDLASYLLETRTGRTTLSAGHISHGRHRHLLTSFSSRGVSGATVIGEFIDLSAAILNATNIVGWDNFSGLHSPKHRIYSGTLGLEVLPQNPGTIRIEGSYTSGSQQPFGSFNRGQINDAEKSTGGSVRMLLSDPARNVTIDAGFAKTRFTNPADPLLSQGVDVVPVEPTTRQARYADVSWEVFRDATIMSSIPARLSVAFRHERVDPLYRAVGVVTRSDNLQNTYELHGGVGPIQCNFTHLQSEDNLANIPSVLKSKTRQTGASVALSPSSGAVPLPSWLPVLSYGLNRTHQFGVGIPTNSSFTAERVPDQVTTSHAAGIEWQGSSVRLGYRGNFTQQDNRQIGRENADVFSRTNGFSLSFSPLSQVSVNLEGSLESTENTDISLINRTKRIGASIFAQLLAGSTVSLTTSLSSSKPDNGSSTQRQSLFSLETSYAFDLSSAFVFHWRGQLFARYSWSEFKSRDNVFNIDTQTRAWAVNTGITFTIF